MFNQLTQKICRLSALLDTLQMKHCHDFIKAFARLRYHNQQIQAIQQVVFQSADALVQTLSMNIYENKKRQVLINQHVCETVEWQRITEKLTAIESYLQYMHRRLDEIERFQSLASWADDVRYSVERLMQSHQALLSSSDTWTMIEANINHRPSNNQLVVRHTHHHDMYQLLGKHALDVSMHQYVFYGAIDDALGNTIGAFTSYKRAVSPIFARCMYQSDDRLRTHIKQHYANQPLIVLANTPTVLSYWKRQLRDMNHVIVLTASSPIPDTLDQQKQYDVLVPNITLPNMLQPEHFIAMSTQDERQYIRRVFHATLNQWLAPLDNITIETLLLNLAPDLEQASYLWYPLDYEAHVDGTTGLFTKRN